MEEPQIKHPYVVINGVRWIKKVFLASGGGRRLEYFWTTPTSNHHYPELRWLVRAQGEPTEHGYIGDFIDH